MSFRVTMLGSGTSTGVPVIGCHCAVCTSQNPRNQRLRTGLCLRLPGGVALVDTPPDLRQQALRLGIERVDAVLYTHAHADHIYGLDDLRIYNFRQRGSIPCYGSADTLGALRRYFSYVFDDEDNDTARPRLELRRIGGPFKVLGMEVTPVPLLHGRMEVLGYRLGDFAYLTDCSRIPESSFALLDDLAVLILGALRYRPHPTHFSVDQALAAAARIGARRTIFTHMSHEIDYERPRASLPAGTEFGYDGLAFEVG